MQVPKAELLIQVEGQEERRLELEPGEYAIGHDPECALQIEAEGISARHALLTLNFDHSLIEDLGSSNGTLINGHPIHDCTRLWPHQKIQIGRATLLVKRTKIEPQPGGSLAPKAAAIQRSLPPELLRSKKYQIGAVVARGGMGAILDTTEATIQRKVARKVMLEKGDPEDHARFINEAKITAQLEHPNIVPVHELGLDEEGQLFYTMKFVRGITLQKVLELLAAGTPGTIGKYPLPHLLRVFQKLCDAIGFAHSKGVIHRDLKPENVMIGDFGEVLVMDWGLAKNLGTHEESRSNSTHSSTASLGARTLVGSILGTPQYMPPEQARGEIEILDARSDIYSLGAILYSILALRPPFLSQDLGHILAAVEAGQFPPPHLAYQKTSALSHLPGGQVPEALSAVTLKAMAKHSHERYRRVSELQDELQAYQNGFATAAEEAGAWRQLLLFLKRHRGSAATVALALMLLSAFMVDVIRSRQQMKSSLERLKGTAPTFRAQALALITKAPNQEGALNQALEQIKYAIQLAPEMAENHLVHGQILQTLQFFPEANQAFAQALRLRPDLKSAIQNQALCQTLQGLKKGSAQNLSRLRSALQEQGRSAEAVLIDRALNASQSAALTRWNSVLKQAGIDRTITVNDRGLLSLNLGALQINDLSFLRGMPLDELSIGRTLATDLAPLAGMPLTRLNALETNLRDLSPLRGMPLKELLIGQSRVSDLSPLRGMPLEKLDLRGLSSINNLTPLQGLPLKWLNISNIGLTSLEFLRGLKLQQLSLGFSSVTDLSPLEGMPLSELDAPQCHRLQNLKSLAALPLKTLRLQFCFQIEDLSPLSQLHLETLDVTASKVRDLSPLRNSQLEWLRLTDTPVSDLNPLRDQRHLLFLDLAGTPVQNLEPILNLPIEILALDRCSSIASLAPLAQFTSLTALSLPTQTDSLASLRALPNLRWLGLAKRMPAGPDLVSALKQNQANDFFAAWEAFGKARLANPPTLAIAEAPTFKTIFPEATRFKNSWYLFVESAAPSWSAAQDFAQQTGGHLATLSNQEEEAFIIKLSGNRLYGQKACWLGARRQQNQWQWADGSPFKWTHWAPNQPGKTSSEEGFLALSATQGGLWFDFPSASPQLTGFILEWEH